VTSETHESTSEGDPARDAIDALTRFVDDPDSTPGVIAFLASNYGVQALPMFIRCWFAIVTGEPGSVTRQFGERAAVRVGFGYAGDDDSSEPLDTLEAGDVDEATAWAGRFAGAWVSGDMDTVHALEALHPRNDYEAMSRAIEVVRGLVEIIERARRKGVNEHPARCICDPCRERREAAGDPPTTEWLRMS
jgi:hypothetical protein